MEHLVGTDVMLVGVASQAVSAEHEVRRLVPANLLRNAVGLLVAASAVLVLTLADIAHRTGPGHLDLLVSEHLIAHTRWTRHVAHTIAGLGSPTGVVPLVAVFAALFVVGRRYRAAALIALSPTVASAITEFVLKPLVSGVPYPVGPALPSGHATGIFSLALAVVLIAVTDRYPRPPGPLQIAAVGAALGVGVAVAVELIAARMHYLSAIICGGLVALVTVLGIALAIDRLASRSTINA